MRTKFTKELHDTKSSEYPKNEWVWSSNLIGALGMKGQNSSMNFGKINYCV